MSSNSYYTQTNIYIFIYNYILKWNNKARLPHSLMHTKKVHHFGLIFHIELGLNDKVVNDKYLGTIFTKQQSGFDP
jgi:hypothetical protein